MQENVVSKKELVKRIQDEFKNVGVMIKHKFLNYNTTWEERLFRMCGDHVFIDVYFQNRPYGASIIRHTNSYGSSQGLFEVAVLKYSPGLDAFRITSDSSFPESVMGHLNLENVIELLWDIYDEDDPYGYAGRAIMGR